VRALSTQRHVLLAFPAHAFVASVSPRGFFKRSAFNRHRLVPKIHEKVRGEAPVGEICNFKCLVSIIVIGYAPLKEATELIEGFCYLVPRVGIPFLVQIIHADLLHLLNECDRVLTEAAYKRLIGSNF
jgi:hypothetical protein